MSAQQPPSGTMPRLGVPVAQAEDGKRAASRRRMLKTGVIAFNNGCSTLPCTVRDISDTGARLRVDRLAAAPDTFELLVDLDGLEADCEVAWRKGAEVGVRFRSPPRKAAPKRTQALNALAPEKTPSLRRKRDPGL